MNASQFLVKRVSKLFRLWMHHN